MIVLGSDSMMMGGQDFDRAIADALRAKCEEQIGHEIECDDVMLCRLQSTAEKVKKDLSTGCSDAEYFIALGMEEFDGLFSREEFEAACTSHNLLDDFYNFVFDTLRKQTAQFSLDAVEMVGCSTFIPQIGDQLLQAVQQAKDRKSVV